jgi:hypothetical protein
LFLQLLPRYCPIAGQTAWRILNQPILSVQFPHTARINPGAAAFKWASNPDRANARNPRRLEGDGGLSAIKTGPRV